MSNQDFDRMSTCETASNRMDRVLSVFQLVWDGLDHLGEMARGEKSPLSHHVLINIGTYESLLEYLFDDIRHASNCMTDLIKEYSGEEQ